MKPKKAEKHELENKKVLFFQLGLVISLLLIFAAFEWKTFEKKDFRLYDPFPFDLNDEDIVINLPVEKIEQPKPKNIDIKIIDDNLKDSVNLFNIEDIPNIPMSEIIYVKPEPIPEAKDDINTIITVAELNPEFEGGIEGLINYLSSNLKYPEMARSSKISGTVHITFVIEPDGSISNIEILRGIGGGCDEEAQRVVKEMPKWKPARQKGRPVRFQFILPITFQIK